jgi:hypothetical protein
MRNGPTRKDKISFIKSLLAGNPIKQPVVFCEYSQHLEKPNVFVDRAGNLLTELEMRKEVSEAGKRAEIVFHEIKTYQN